ARSNNSITVGVDMVPSLVPGVPDLHRPIPTAGGGDASSVGAERHASDLAGVSLERPQVEMAKPIEVEPFEAAEIGLALPGPFTLQEIQHPADVGVIPLPLGQVHVRDVGAAASQAPLRLGLELLTDGDLLLLERVAPLDKAERGESRDNGENDPGDRGNCARAAAALARPIANGVVDEFDRLG